jgi:Zn-dependent protease with chaperone function
VANAAAVRYGKKNVLLLTDDLVSGFLLAREPKALAFILGHELGHIVLGHTGMIRSFLRGAYKKLGRCDEYSADRIGAALVGNADIAFNGILLLTSGALLMPFVNRDQVKQQAEEVAVDKYSKKAERKLSHPLLLNRLRRVLQGQH